MKVFNASCIHSSNFITTGISYARSLAVDDGCALDALLSVGLLTLAFGSLEDDAPPITVCIASSKGFCRFSLIKFTILPICSVFYLLHLVLVVEYCQDLLLMVIKNLHHLKF